MELKIRFSAERDCAVSKPEKIMGLDYVERIRDEIGAKNFSLEKIPEKIDSICQNPIIKISEQLAIASGLFRKTNYIEVIVNDYGLNKYIFSDFEIEKNLETGGVEKIIPKYSIDCEQVLKDWEKAGFPLFWYMKDKE